MAEAQSATTAGGSDEPAMVLEQMAVEVLTTGAPRSLAPQLDELLGLDLQERPFAGLLVAAAYHDVYRGHPRVVELAEAAWEQLLRRQDEQGLGVAANVRANIAFARGDLDEALAWWRRCLDLLDGGVPLGATALAHLSVEAYRRGDLHGAIARAEEARSKLIAAGDRPAQLVPLVYLVLYDLNLGDFARAEAELDRADGIWKEIASAGVRNDGPLLSALRGVLEALRGHRGESDAAFAQALATADELSAPWYAVMARCMRGEFTAAWEPERSLADGHRAREEALAIGDRWWTSLSVLAEASALRELARFEDAIERFGHAAEDLSNPLERARALVGMGETHLRSGDRPAARAAFEEALGLVEPADARYWVARVCAGLAAAERDRGQRWIAQARSCSDADPAYDFLRPSGTLRIELTGRPSVHLGGQRVVFLTRHAEVSVYALALAGERGVEARVLAEVLWPAAAPTRRNHRLRTLLWQVRNGLGSQAWRVARRGERLVLDRSGVEIVGDATTLDDRSPGTGLLLRDVLAELDLTGR
jgi:tetratricopeptide (TPR) repeat protein